MAMNDNREVTYEIVEEIGVLTAHQTGWNKEINMVSWNGNSAKYDIRDWSPDHAQMGRGITLHEKEMRMMLELLRKRPRSNRAHRSEDPGELRAMDGGGSGNEEAAFCRCDDEPCPDVAHSDDAAKDDGYEAAAV